LYYICPPDQNFDFGLMTLHDESSSSDRSLQSFKVTVHALHTRPIRDFKRAHNLNIASGRSGKLVTHGGSCCSP